MDPLDLRIAGKGNGPDLAKNERFQQALTSFVKDLAAIGCKIEVASLDYAGKTTDVLAGVHAGA